MEQILYQKRQFNLNIMIKAARKPIYPKGEGKSSL